MLSKPYERREGEDERRHVGAGNMRQHALYIGIKTKNILALCLERALRGTGSRSAQQWKMVRGTATKTDRCG